MLSIKQKADFDRDGYVIVPDMFSRAEVDVLLHHVEAGARVAQGTRDMPDAAGQSSKLALWFEPGDDAFGAVSRNPRMVRSAEQLLGEQVYHWHSKVMLKEARQGGAWEWHQDYGYWYNDHLLYPRLVSCMLALDDATRANGCLKVVAGSHHLGRLDHGRRGNQNGTDPERIKMVLEQRPVVYAEAPAGSVLFFHCNTLHSSEANRSERPRRAFICCYNAFDNPPYGQKGHGAHKPLQLVPDNDVLRFAPKHLHA